jgi:hypothetical protein
VAPFAAAWQASMPMSPIAYGYCATVASMLPCLTAVIASLLPSTLITCTLPVLPASAMARATPRPMSSLATKKPARSGCARMMLVAWVSASWRSQLAATVCTRVRVVPMPFVKPSTRAPLVTSPAMPPIAATLLPAGTSVTMCLAAVSPADTLLVPM